MTAEKLVKEIQEYCTKNANPENVLKINRYFKEPHDAYGLTQPQIISKTKALLKNRDITLDIAIQVTDMLVSSGKFEEPVFGLLLVNGRGKFFTKEHFKQIARWYSRGINNWAHADTLGMMILPQFMLKNKIELQDFQPWITSPYKFQRRCVPVTLIKVLKNNKTADFALYFKFIEPFMTDKEREVHQGTGWFLREAWKIQPQATEAFLLKWKDVSPRLIIQYATEKMSKEDKVRFKKVKA